MKRKIYLLVSVLLIFVMLFTGCSNSSETKAPVEQKGNNKEVSNEKVYELKISHVATTTDPIHQGWSFLKETLESKSEGRIKVTIFPNKQLSNSNNEDAEKVQQNIVQMTSVPTSSLAAIGDIKEYKVFDYPYLFETNEDLYKVIDSEIGDSLSKKLIEKTGIKAVGAYSLGWCGISTNKGPINSPEDIKGQKIRTLSSDLHIALIKAFGGSATPINYGEVFTALQQGTVDGMMTTTGLYVSDKFYEVQDYLGTVNAVSLLHVPIVNNEWYESLPDDLKAIYDESIDLYLDEVRKYEEEFDAKALQTLKDVGMEVQEYTPEQKQAFIDATANVINENENIAGKEIIDQVKTKLGK